MSGEIKVGDRVMLVYAGCACVTQWIGDISEVREIRFERAYCTNCLNRTSLGAHAVILLGDEWGPIPVTWLLRLPPDAERINNDIAEPCAAT